MAKTLSNRDIEALLASPDATELAVRGGTERGRDKSAKTYDFRRPDKFSKDHLRGLQKLHETFARNASQALTSYLRSSCTVTVTSVKQVVYDEYIEGLENATVVNLLELLPLAGQIVLEFNLQLAAAMLDRMMGGPGYAGAARSELTEIELALLSGLSATLANGLREAWAPVEDLQPVLTDTVLSAEFVQAALPSDVAAQIQFEIQTLGTTGRMSICVPHPVIEPIMEKLTAQMWLASSKKGETESGRLKLGDGLQDVMLPITVELGSAKISVAELWSLREGDVVRLNRPAGSDLSVRVNDQPRFVARPGVVAGNRAVQITEVLRQTTRDDD